ncbi:hypothetical protein Mal65_15760 [Crateriforma conspicua]|nr:hypothetical protein Mal65_15760 [Crateriforma conspicua]
MTTTLRSISLSILVLACSPLSAQMKYLDRMDAGLKNFSLRKLVALRADQPPVLDGKLDDDCWKESNVYTDFQKTCVGPGELVANQTNFYVLFDQRYLYVAFECFEDDMSGLRTKAFIQDDEQNIQGDDRVEVWLDLDHDHWQAVNLVLSASGATMDQTIERPVQYAFSSNYKPQWNGKWHSSVSRYDDRWTAEIFIDVNHISNRKNFDGRTFGLLAGRGRSSRVGNQIQVKQRQQTQFLSAEQKNAVSERNTFDYARFAEYSSIPYCEDRTDRMNTYAGFSSPIRFADLVCGENPLAVRSIAFNEAHANYSGRVWQKPMFWGNNPLRLHLKNTSESALNIAVEVATQDQNGDRALNRQTLKIPAEESRQVTTEIKIRDFDFQSFEVKISDANTGRLFYHTSYMSRVPPFVEFDLEAVYLPQEQSGRIRCIPVMHNADTYDLTVSLIRQETGEVIASELLTEFSSGNDYIVCLGDHDIKNLPAGDYALLCQLIDARGMVAGTFKQLFTRKVYGDDRSFSARRETYSYGGVKGDAVVVSFPGRKDMVFPEHTSYIPFWDFNNVGVSYEFVEAWGYGSQSCNEPMQDKKNRYTRVEIIENTPSRVTVLYQYALNNNNYKIYFNEWVDELYTFYPDGTGTRNIRIWANTDLHHTTCQPQYVIPPGILPEAILEPVITRVSNIQGENVENRLGSEVTVKGYNKSWNEEILRIPLKNRPDAFLVLGKNQGLVDNYVTSNFLYQNEDSRDVRFNLGAHWPMSEIDIDVFNIVSVNRPYHSWIGNMRINTNTEREPNEVTLLIGATDQDDDHIRLVASSWLYPARVVVLSHNAVDTGFNHVKKAYELTLKKGALPKVELRFLPQKFETIINPAIMLRDFHRSPADCEVFIKGNRLAADKYSLTSIGSNDSDMLIWIDKAVSAQDTILIR